MPEEDCKSTNQSHSFQWKPWLTTCIRAYYNTGTIRIPDECIGSDILLALEYFGVLYSPDQLVFDSFGGYLRVKLWSDYFTHRAKMADWVVQQLVTTPSRHSHAYVTCPNIEQNEFYMTGDKQNKTIRVLDGNLALDKARYGTTPSRAVVHEFFNDDDQEEDSPPKMDHLMRQDFCAFVQASLPGTNVSFSLQQVVCSSDSNKEPVERAILRINLVPKSPTSSTTSPSTTASGVVETSNTVVQPPIANPMGHQVPNATKNANGGNGTPQSAADVSGSTPESAVHVSGSTPQSAANVSGSTPQSAIHAQDAHVAMASGTTPQSAFLFPDNKKTEIARAIVNRRISQEQRQAMNRSFEDRPHDEYTPTSSPLKQSHQWSDEPSIDRPRETLQDSSEFVRSLSQKVIRQTLADMDTIHHGLTSTPSATPSGGPTLRPASETPFDEQGDAGVGSDPRLTEDDIQMCMLPSLPSFENDKDYSRPPTKTQLPFHPKQKSGCKAPVKKLEVIGQITTPQSTPKRLSPPNATNKPAPVPQIDLDNAKPCDGSVMSALSSPFDDATVDDPLDGLDARRPQAQMEVLGGFRTPVDALSLADDKSVRIENQDDDEDEEDEEEEEEEAGVEEEEEVEVEDEEQEQESSRRKKKPTRQSQRQVYVDPDDMSQTGCVGSFLNVICSPLTGGEVNHKKKRAHRRDSDDHSNDDTPETRSETDEDDDEPSGERRRRSSHRHRSKSSEELSGQEMISEIGGMADTLVDGIAASFGSMFGSTKELKRRPASRRSSRRHQYDSASDIMDESTYDPSTLDETDDFGGDETTVEDTVEDMGDIVRIMPRPRERPVGKHDRPPLPMKHRSPSRHASPKGPESSLERIQGILRSKDSSHHSSTRRSANVKRNLELLQAADAPVMNDFGNIGRISVVDSSSSARQRSKSTGRAQDNKKKDNKKGLLGFLRKK
jgi:hypothetical protein